MRLQHKCHQTEEKTLHILIEYNLTYSFVKLPLRYILRVLFFKNQDNRKYYNNYKNTDLYSKFTRVYKISRIINYKASLIENNINLNLIMHFPICK